MKSISSAWILCVGAAFVAVGCGSARDVAVSGETTAPAAVTGSISIQFFDTIDDEAALAVLKEVTLDAAGPFSETIEVEGDAVRILALIDEDGDGQCTEGEAWAQVEAEVSEEDTIESVQLVLEVAACPTLPAAEPEG